MNNKKIFAALSLVFGMFFLSGCDIDPSICWNKAKGNCIDFLPQGA
ncbi:MAG: hypothetical protein V4629_02840 [Pseudomonadota bacterium]